MKNYILGEPILDKQPGTIIKVGIDNCVACELTEGVLKRLRKMKPDANIISYRVPDEYIADFAETYEVRSFPFIVLRGRESEVIPAKDASLNRLIKFVEAHE